MLRIRLLETAIENRVKKNYMRREVFATLMVHKLSPDPSVVRRLSVEQTGCVFNLLLHPFVNPSQTNGFK
jgi:hypothetical protein